MADRGLTAEPKQLSWLSRRLRGRARAERRAAQAASFLAELAPGSATLEACRTLRASLGGGLAAPPPLLVLGLGSDGSHAVVAAGLAAALAEEERQTLLIDADLRGAPLHALFALPRGPGLAEAIESGAAPPVPTPVRNLWLLPAGTSNRSAAELLRSPALPKVLERARGGFDAVVYNAPADPSYPDALLLAAHVRSAVLVVRAGADTADDMRAVRAPLESAGLAFLGFALFDARGAR